MIELRRRALQMLVVLVIGLGVVVALQSLRSQPDPTACHPWDRACAKAPLAR